MRNVALIVLDSVRKDVFDEVSTRLRAKADVEYDQCRAPSTWSVPSHASILTGELPHNHGVDTYNRQYNDISASDTFLDGLPDHRSIGVSANVFAGEAFGFDQFFDEFVSISADRRFPEGMDAAKFGLESDEDGLRKQLSFVQEALKHEHSLRSLLNGALVTVDEVTKQLPFPKPLDKGGAAVCRAIERETTGPEREEPFFLFANIMDAHGPLTPTRGFDHDFYDAPSSWRSEDIDWDRVIKVDEEIELERYHGLYRAAVDYLDQRVSTLIDTIQQRTDRPTTFLITADHGENMGSATDDQLWEHSESSLTEGLLHVPAIVVNPPGKPPSDLGNYVSQLALGNLLTGFAHDEYPDITSEAIAAERIGSNKSDPKRERIVRCVYRGETKYCWDNFGVQRRFHLDWGTPSWQEEVDGEVPIDELETQFFSNNIETALDVAVDDERGDELDESTERKLQDLGYV